MKAVFDSENFGEYETKVICNERKKSQCEIARNSYIPLDQILKEMILTHHQPAQIPNFSSYYSKENISKISKLKPQTANIAKRNENSRRVKKLSVNYNKNNETSNFNYDLPYINEKDKTGFLSQKINLVPRIATKYSHFNRKTLSKNEQILDRTNIVNASIILPKLCEEEDSHPFQLEEQELHSESEESKTTYKSFDSGDEYNQETERDRKIDESPLKKWLTHNRNFEIKINMVVSGGDKNIKQV